jgi:NADPH:quinone reductase-like Zn-dependent oxidoreductase
MSGMLYGLELRSLVTPDWQLELSLQPVEVADPDPDQVVLRVEAAPVNPSDVGRLLSGVDLETLVMTGDDRGPVISAKVHSDRVGPLAAPLGTSAPVGNEGAGTVIKAGVNVQSLLGKTVSVRGGGMYTQYRLMNADDCMVLPEGTRAAEGASAFVNPMTALCILETVKAEGYKALVHTAAASALGQMLVRLCLADDIPLVNVVRSAAQAAMLRGIGACHVVDSSSPDFMEKLTDAIAATGATVAFDAIGGGPLATQLLGAMESAISRNADGYSRYGSTTHKQLYVYGGLNTGPICIDRRSIGMYRGVDSFMTAAVRERIGEKGRQRMQSRIAAELTTTFATQYKAELSLAELLAPEMLAVIARRATGEKYLVNPQKGVAA